MSRFEESKLIPVYSGISKESSLIFFLPTSAPFPFFVAGLGLKGPLCNFISCLLKRYFYAQSVGFYIFTRCYFITFVIKQKERDETWLKEPED